MKLLNQLECVASKHAYRGKKLAVQICAVNVPPFSQRKLQSAVSRTLKLVRVSQAATNRKEYLLCHINICLNPQALDLSTPCIYIKRFIKVKEKNGRKLKEKQL